MKNANIIKIADRIVSLDEHNIVNRLPYEETDGFYNVWKIDSGGVEYILKRVAQNEKDFYAQQKVDLSVFPKCFGTTSFYGKDYILLEFVNGKNLMKCNRKQLVKVLDAMIELQNAYFEGDEQIGQPFEEFVESANARRQHLEDDELVQAFDVFLKDYMSIARTLCHDDLLPFNVILSGERVVFIDWEHSGFLPYPTMLARFVAHTSEHGETPFFMAKEDVEFAIEYFYEHFVKLKGIDFETYRFSLECCLFFESIEWVYVYNKYGKERDAFFDYSFALAKDRAKSLLLK